MSADPLPMDEIERKSREDIEGDPNLVVVDDHVPVDTLVTELGILEEGAEQSFEEGAIPRETRLGMLISVAHLREMLRRAADSDPTDTTEGGTADA